jgi:hypothetical protein
MCYRPISSRYLEVYRKIFKYENYLEYMKKIIALLLACILFSGCVSQKSELREGSETKEPGESGQVPGESGQDSTHPPEEAEPSLTISHIFAPYTPVVVTFTGGIKDYPYRPVNSDQVSLTQTQFETLTTQGFVAVPSGYTQFYSLYKTCYDNNMPIFITTDSVLHTYHIIYDYTLRIAETDRLSGDILLLTRQMADQSYQYYETTGDEAALKNVAYFSVAGKLLDENFPIRPEVAALVEGELDLITAHTGFVLSPIFGYKEDYSQYVPRGHYTRSETLEKYFKAMMWYGRIMFRLKSVEETKQALYMVKAIEDTDTFVLWDRVYEPTVFFVGKTDDLSILEYGTLAGEIFGELTVSQIQDQGKVTQFIEAAKKLRDPRINSSWVRDDQTVEEETKGFRFMGQRFIPDSYMFQQLVYNKVGTMQDPRLFPKGLDVMAVLGSGRALEHLESEKQYENYESQMAALQQEFEALDQDVWTQNLYWTWIYSLLPLLIEKGDDYPPFMRSKAWADKELNTALGSWTELRHDTILYAKQSYTLKATATPSQPQLTRGYVEPNPYVYARLASLAHMMREGLEERDLLLPEYSGKLQDLESLLLQLKTISEKELSGEPLTDEEFRVIWTIGFTLESLVTFQTAIESEADKSVEIVADVHTDVNTSQVLEEGVGKVFMLFVVVNVDGRIQIVQGGIFSYYEFLQAMSNRLTDEEWQAMEPPPLPEWTGSFII